MKRPDSMLRKSLIALVLILSANIVSYAVLAQEAAQTSLTNVAPPPRGLLISPKRVVFGERERMKELILANRGTEEEKYRISIVNKKMLKNGQFVETDTAADGEFLAEPYIRFSPRQVTLGPKETQKVRFMSRLPSDAADGEYRSHILIQEVPKPAQAESANTVASDELGINISAIFGISLPVIMRKGDLDYAVTLSAPKLRRTQEATYVDFTINRTGNKSTFGTVKVFAGAAEIGILKNVAVYLSTPQRDISVALDPERAQNLSGKELRITYSAVEAEEDAPSSELRFTAQ